MKIAYLVLAHTDPAHISRLANKLTECSLCEVFIHVDKKVDIDPFYRLLRNNPSVHFISDRKKVYWGGYSSVLATINLFKSALNHGSFERFVILQGLDYPIKSNKEIHDFFVENPSTEFIKSMDATEDKQLKTQHKYRLIWFLDNDNIFKKIWNRVNSELLKRNFLISFKKPYMFESNRKYKIYQGWAHFALTRKCVEYIVNFHDSHPRFNKYFSTSYASDESYFHTIVYNSEFVNNTVDGKSIENKEISSLLNVTYFEYPKFVTVFKHKSDFDKLYNTKYLFFRKASSESKELLDYIDNYHEQSDKFVTSP